MAAKCINELLWSETQLGLEIPIFRLSQNIVAVMHEIVIEFLVHGDSEMSEKLQELFVLIFRINWRLIDPDYSTRPCRNDYSAPVYDYGYYVPFYAGR